MKVLVVALLLCAAVPAGQSQDAPSGTLREVRGKKLYVEKLGSGPPVVFLHGGMSFFDNTFQQQRAAFAAGHTVIGIDQAGHGHSPDVPGAFSYPQMAEDTASVLEQLGLPPADVIGLSDGANVALLLARDHPERVRRVVVSGANLRPGLPAEELTRRSHWTTKQKDENVRKLAARMPPWFRADYDRVSPDGPGHYLTVLAKCSELWMSKVMEPSDLKRISAPVLVMAGDHDFSSLEETAEVFRGLPHGRLFILPNTGHGTFGERPELVNLAVREFLAER